ncbi:MAG: Spy/CpxP family protein refolding chaperone [Myxococcota bacterium]
MFGFFFGAICLGGLAALLFSRPHHRFGHRGHCGGFGGRYGRGRYGINMAFDRLDTTPGQEKAILAALDELSESARGVRSRVASSRSDVADALRSDHFDSDRVHNVVARHAEDFATLGNSVTATLAKIHEALDPEQRKRLARWLDSGPGFFHFA